MQRFQNFEYITNLNIGLGDALSCFNSNRIIWSPSPSFSMLKKYTTLNCNDRLPIGKGLLVDGLHHIDFKGEHLFNRVRIASGLEPHSLPRATLDLVRYKPSTRNVAFSFDVGAVAVQQRIKIHPRARQLYPEFKIVFQEFIDRNKFSFDFYEIGINSFGFRNVTNATAVGLDKTIDVLSNSQFFIGMHSGLVHLATAVGCKCMVAVNFPAPHFFDFKNKGCLEKETEMHWLYPQHKYLHEDCNSSELSFSIQNLECFIK